MGKHFAEAAAKAGAKVFVGDVDEKGLAELPIQSDTPTLM